MIIPVDERTIGTTADANSETRTFLVPRTDMYGDLGDLIFYMDVTLPDGQSYDTSLPDKEIVSDELIRLTWTVPPAVLTQEGTIFVQLRAVDEDNVLRWTSIKGALYVEAAVVPDVDEEDLSLIWQLANRVVAVEKKMELIDKVWDVCVELIDDPEIKTLIEDSYASLSARIDEKQDAATAWNTDNLLIVDDASEVTDEGKIYLVKVSS